MPRQQEGLDSVTRGRDAISVLFGSVLAEHLRQLADKVKRRIWVVSPYVGDRRTLFCVLGNRWQLDPRVDVRLLTDADDNPCLNPRTLRVFEARGQVKSLPGLHAKVYIVDNTAILASANLTRHGFVQRYEVGCHLDRKASQAVIRQVDTWWDKHAVLPADDWITKIEQGRRKEQRPKEEPGATSLRDLWKLPEAPAGWDSSSSRFRDYPGFLSTYRQFSREYERAHNRVWPDLPLFLETDGFLDYLFHHAKGTPSRQFKKKAPRKLSGTERTQSLKRHSEAFAQWVKGRDDDRWRKDGWHKIRSLLAVKKIDEISRANIITVTNQLNCMASVAIARKKFLNPRNNSLGSIRSAWKTLLHRRDLPMIDAMERCAGLLTFFGRSSTQELMGWYNPRNYPLRNVNSNAGLRFFGYKVSIY